MSDTAHDLKAAMKRVEIDREAIRARLEGSDWLETREALWDLVAAHIKTIAIVDSEIRRLNYSKQTVN